MKSKVVIILIAVFLATCSYYLGRNDGEKIPQLYAGQSVAQWANKDLHDNKLNSGKIASQAAQIKQLQNAPTPTPEIVYKTNTVTQTKTQFIPMPQAAPYYRCTSSGFGSTCSPY